MQTAESVGAAGEVNFVGLSEYCRVCLQLPEESQLLDLNLIYDEDEQLSYHECFTTCTQIDLSAGDGVPHNLCKSCGLELQVAYDFHKKVEESKRFLSQIESQYLETVKGEEEFPSSTTEAAELASDNGSAAEVAEEEEVLTADEIVIEQLAATTDCEELEEHLEMEDFQSVEELVDDDAETVQIKFEYETSTEEFVIETISVSDNETEYQIKNEPKTNQSNKGSRVSITNSITPLKISSPIKTNTTVSKISDSTGVTSSLEHLPTNVTEAKTVKQSLSTGQQLLSRNTAKDMIYKERRRFVGKFSCEYCNKEFRNHCRMLSHRLSHEPDRPKYHCEECGRIYVTKQAKDLHIRAAHNKTGHVCSICGKIYAIRKGLEVHMRFHTGEFPYVCDLCGKKFAQMCHLNTHKNVQHRSVRFSCEYPSCGKFFTSSASLRNHEFTHGTMPFECEYCQNGYPSKSKLKVHIRRKHGMELTLEQLEQMRKFHVMRSKLKMVQITHES